MLQNNQQIEFLNSPPPWTPNLDIENLNNKKIDEIIDTAYEILANHFSRYQKRQEQINISRAILKNLLGTQNYIFEAGTGIGKSFAYLIPAIAYSYISGEKVVISTETKNLQLQLINKDLPIIKNILDQDLTSELALGSNNYFCQLRHEDSFKSGSFQHTIGKKELEEYKIWSNSIIAGKADGHQYESEAVYTNEFWSLINRDPEGCPASRCIFFNNCNYFRLKVRWSKARIIVANHHLFLYNLINDKRSLPPYGAAILDEAHGFAKTGQSILTNRFSIDTVRDLKKMFDRTTSGSLPPEAREEWNEIWKSTELAWDILFSAWEVELNLSFEENKSSVLKQKATIDSRHLLENIEGLLKQCKDLMELTEDSSELNKINSIFKTMERSSRMIHAYSEMNLAKYVYWGDKKNNKLALNACNLNLGEELAPYLTETTVWTSATLGYWPNNNRAKDKNELISNGYFNNFVQEVPGPQMDSDTIFDYYPSPFNYKKNAALYIASDVNEPDWKADAAQKKEYENRLIEEICRLIKLSEGGVLVLFTSYYLLEKIGNEIKSKINYPVFIQKSANASEALDNFINTENSILMGTNSYWQGIDIVGNHLRMVIITKLMFTPPDDPVFLGRSTLLEKKNEKSFYKLSLPFASMMLKQAFGRLIRSETDKGVIAILDNRMKTKSYGEILRSNLPELTIVDTFQKLKEVINKNKIY